MTNPTEFLLSLRGFIVAAQNGKAVPSEFGHDELAAGQGLVSAIDKMVNAKVQEGIKAFAEQQMRRPQR